MRVAYPVATTIVVLCVVIFGFAPRWDILTTIEIRTPPSRIWAVLTDTRAYPEWNPMIAGLKGKLAAGEVVENIEGYGDDRTIFWPRILVAKQDQELRWLGHLWGIPRLLDGEHYFLLQPTPEGTLLTQGEHFTGVVLWIFDVCRLMRPFEAMNVALKARAERDPASRPPRS